MKVWKLVSGILSIVLFVFVTFQSCAAGVANTLSEMVRCQAPQELWWQYLCWQVE